MLRNLLSLVLIVVVLVAAGAIQQEVQNYLLTRDAIAALKRGQAIAESDVDSLRKEFSARAGRFKKEGQAALVTRIKALEQEIAQKSSGRGAPPDPKICVLMGGDACDRYFDDLKRAAQISFLAHERDVLMGLQTALAVDHGARELMRLGQVHVAVYAQYQNAESAVSAFKRANPFWWVPLSRASQRLQPLDQERGELFVRNKGAFDAFMRQKTVLDTLKKSGAVVEKWDEQGADLFQSLNFEIRAREEIYRQNWVARFFESAHKVVPTALTILLGILLAPPAIKGFLYFVIAPIASRRAPITLLPGVSGHIEGVPESLTGDAPRRKVSEVSQSVTIDQTQELLIHPEYLQSSAMHGQMQTKWLLDWAYPLSSMAAGLFGLTRIRTSSTDTIVVSATKDPLIEVAVLALPAGSALVFQPHRLIGIVQQKDQPAPITRHWRLGSLNAWLTLQLRYLVFHGPVTLVVTGCRGVRVEPTGRGRSINQAATIGFSANVAYSTLRCETFGAYLLGRQELFNDNFGGSPGFYVYEEMPHGGGKTGLFGRGLSGFADSVLKVFGV